MENDQCSSYYDPADYLSPTECDLRNEVQYLREVDNIILAQREVVGL